MQGRGSVIDKRQFLLDVLPSHATAPRLYASAIVDAK